ncbi:MAG: hypothetical protein JSR41_03805 [Proteobacteria bacterium]|nr:hypothetical protein [Pseudomonadota bacterium]
MATPSGLSWVSRFPTSTQFADLAPPFRSNAKNFVDALRAAGIGVAVSATLRPPERAYLMHHAFRIAHEGLDPATAPAMRGVDIDWVHRRRDGSADPARSRSAAAAMVTAYDIVFRPALMSNHTRGLAIDMTIGNYRNKQVSNASGVKTTLKSAADLHGLGATYGVHKLASDPPHWSSDGH